MFKKIIITVLAFVMGMSIFAGCGTEDKEEKKVASFDEIMTKDQPWTPEPTEEPESVKFETSGDVIDITEKMYVTWINEIYINKDAYIGKKIRLEGMYKSVKVKETNKSYSYVYRQGPGCCGTDGGMCGFEFTYDGKMPKEKEWIEVVGTLDAYEEDGGTYLTLKDTTVTVKTERGKEIVAQ